MTIKFTIPYPPTINHYWGQRGTRKFIKKEGLMFRQAVANIVADLGVKEVITCKLKVTLDVFPPDRRKRDLDNVQKSILDAIQHSGLIEDDYQIDQLITTRQDVTPPGGVDIILEEI